METGIVACGCVVAAPARRNGSNQFFQVGWTKLVKQCVRTRDIRTPVGTITLQAHQVAGTRYDGSITTPTADRFERQGFPVSMARRS